MAPHGTDVQLDGISRTSQFVQNAADKRRPASRWRTAPAVTARLDFGPVVPIR